MKRTALWLVAIASCTVLSFRVMLGAGFSSEEDPTVKPLDRVGVESRSRAPYVNFESGPRRPLLLSSSGERLYVLNTPDHRLECYGLPSLERQRSIFVGLEPVSMVEHPDDPSIVFVANHVSDSVSVVDVENGHVVATLQAGDEPSDLVIAESKLFVACARFDVGERGYAPKVRPRMIENAILAFDIKPPYRRQGVVGVAAHKPRSLAFDGERVWVAPQDSGNNTTVLPQRVAEGLQPRMDQQLEEDAYDQKLVVNPILTRPEFKDKATGWSLPRSARIVYDWEYPEHVRQTPDNDLIPLDPETLEVSDRAIVRDIGTTLFGLERDPQSGRLWIVCTESRNRIRMESRLKGVAFENRAVVVDPKKGERRVLKLEPPFTQRPHAQPVAVAIDEQERKVFVASLGTSSLLVLGAEDENVLAEIDAPSLPIGIVCDSARSRLYALARGDHAIHVLDYSEGYSWSQVVSLGYDPEPPSVRNGRRHLYEARADQGHGNGTMSCASCHVFGHGDGLAWDLGDSSGSFAYFYPDLLTGPLGFDGKSVFTPSIPVINPMKGPMVTQSLRGIMDDLPLHWRGDRRFFHQFRSAYKGLVGGDGVSSRTMQEFAVFARTLTYPPNPYQNLDRSYTGVEGQGRDMFGLSSFVAGKEYKDDLKGFTCLTCHEADFASGSDFSGSRRISHFGGLQQMNPAPLRGIYEKDDFALTGFGTHHDGDLDGIRGYMDIFMPDGKEGFGELTAQERSQSAQFVKAWDTGLSPMVGRQVTLEKSTQGSLVSDFIDLATSRARPPYSDLDLIAKGWIVDEQGTSMLSSGVYQERGEGWVFETDGGALLSLEDVLSRAEEGTLSWTLTCVPKGMGRRLGIDRDEDGVPDGVEIALGTDAADPDSDDDGYDDGFEWRQGTAVASHDESLDDDRSPAIESFQVEDAFSCSATLVLKTDEPARARIELSYEGQLTPLTFDQDALRCDHRVVLDGLDAGRSYDYRLEVMDRNGNRRHEEGMFSTQKPMLHLAMVTIRDVGEGEVAELEAQIRIVDEGGRGIEGVPLTGYWVGFIGANGPLSVLRTDKEGYATQRLNPFEPQAASTVTFSPLVVGSTNPADPFFVGVAGNDESFSFYYNQAANEAHFATIELGKESR